MPLVQQVGLSVLEWVKRLRMPKPPIVSSWKSVVASSATRALILSTSITNQACDLTIPKT
eukprot:2826249-Amphidinium_carterae.1